MLLLLFTAILYTMSKKRKKKTKLVVFHLNAKMIVDDECDKKRMQVNMSREKKILQMGLCVYVCDRIKRPRGGGVIAKNIISR